MSEKKSCFSVTCSLLSQFLKEKRSFGELGLIDMASRPPAPIKGIFRPPTTRSLLLGVDVSAETEAVSASDRHATKPMELFLQQTGFESPKQRTDTDTKEEEKAKHQLTLFYAGKVLVFDNFPADKANGLMQLAAKGSSAAAPSTASALAGRPPVSGASSSDGKPAPAPATPSDLPMTIARRTSLHRFFSKRKDRITSKAPYQVNGSSPPSSGAGESAGEPEETRAWLGFGLEIANRSSTSEKQS